MFRRLSLQADAIPEALMGGKEGVYERDDWHARHVNRVSSKCRRGEVWPRAVAVVDRDVPGATTERIVRRKFFVLRTNVILGDGFEGKNPGRRDGRRSGRRSERAFWVLSGCGREEMNGVTSRTAGESPS